MLPHTVHGSNAMLLSAGGSQGKRELALVGKTSQRGFVDITTLSPSGSGRAKRRQIHTNPGQGVGTDEHRKQPYDGGLRPDVLRASVDSWRKATEMETTLADQFKIHFMERPRHCSKAS
jgi:hypothetical protein